MSSEEIEVMTGPVRVSGYALKLRRVINGVFSKRVKKGEVDSKELNDSITELNRKIFQVLVEKYKVPKEAVTNIRLKIVLEGSKVRVKEVNVDIYDIDEILSKNATDDLREVLIS